MGANNKPVALIEYNRWMRGVDKSNQYVSYYHTSHKAVKWWKALFISLVETSITNAHLLYKLRNPFGFDQLRFREELMIDLLQLSQNINQLNPLERIIPGLHEIGIRDQRNCSICSTATARKTTTYYCINCNKNVCIVPCFHLMHTKLILYGRNKHVNMNETLKFSFFIYA